MSKALTIGEKGREVRSMLARMRGEIAAALPRHLTPDRMARIALTVIKSNPKLMDCTQESLAGAVIQAAQLGLEPGSGLAQCAIVPRKNKGVSEAQFQPMYGGLCELAIRSGSVLSIYASVVWDDEEFEFVTGDEQKITHKPKLDRTEMPTWDNLVLAYAVATLRGGAKMISVCQKYQIQRARDCSTAYKYDTRGSLWVTHLDRMAEKTALIRLCKILPKSAELMTAINLDSQFETGGQSFKDMFDDDTPMTQANTIEGEIVDGEQGRLAE